MKLSGVLASSLLATSVVATPDSHAAREGASSQLTLNGPGSDQYLIETEPGKTQWVTEDEKWVLKRVSV